MLLANKPSIVRQAAATAGPEDEKIKKFATAIVEFSKVKSKLTSYSSLTNSTVMTVTFVRYHCVCCTVSFVKKFSPIFSTKLVMESAPREDRRKLCFLIRSFFASCITPLLFLLVSVV